MIEREASQIAMNAYREWECESDKIIHDLDIAVRERDARRIVMAQQKRPQDEPRFETLPTDEDIRLIDAEETKKEEAGVPGGIY